MNLLIAFNNVQSGVFIHTKAPARFETRQQRQKRVRDKRKKQWVDSFFAIGNGYHKF